MKKTVKVIPKNKKEKKIAKLAEDFINYELTQESTRNILMRAHKRWLNEFYFLGKEMSEKDIENIIDEEFKKEKNEDSL